MHRSIIAMACLFPLAGVGGFNDTNTVVLHVASHHFNPDIELNESNPGLGVRYGMGRFFLHAGEYRNSLAHTSVYAGAGATLYSVGPVSFGVIAGVITGYADRVYPIVLPEVAVHYGRTSVLLSYAPKLVAAGVTNPAVVSLSFGVGF